MATPFELHPADAFASQGGAFVSVGKDVASRKQALANETLYVRARGAELLYTFPTAFYIVANTWHVRGRAAIDHLARHGSRAIAEVAARHPRMRAMLAENPQGLPPGMYYVIAPRLPPTVLERMWAVVQPSPESGPRSWERVVHERINTCVECAVRGRGPLLWGVKRGGLAFKLSTSPWPARAGRSRASTPRPAACTRSSSRSPPRVLERPRRRTSPCAGEEGVE